MEIVQPRRADKNIYLEGGYYHRARWASYYYQYQSIFNKGCKTVLEIGPGGGITTMVLRQHGVKVTTLDVDPTIKPDVVGDVLKLPFPDNSFDAVVGFEILEHLPFESFAAALSEMRRVSKEHVMISLPDHAKTLFQMTIKLPFMKEREVQIRVPARDNSRNWAPAGHHWELGNRQYPFRKVSEQIRKADLTLEVTRVWNACPMTRFIFMKK